MKDERQQHIGNEEDCKEARQSLEMGESDLARYEWTPS